MIYNLCSVHLTILTLSLYYIYFFIVKLLCVDYKSSFLPFYYTYGMLGYCIYFLRECDCVVILSCDMI